MVVHDAFNGKIAVDGREQTERFAWDSLGNCLRNSQEFMHGRPGLVCWFIRLMASGRLRPAVSLHLRRFIAGGGLVQNVLLVENAKKADACCPRIWISPRNTADEQILEGGA